MDGVPSDDWFTNNICAMCEDEALKLYGKSIGANMKNKYTYMELYRDTDIRILSIFDLVVKRLNER